MPDSVGSRLRLLMELAGVSSLAMKKALTVSKTTIAGWRNDKQAIRPENQDAIIAFLARHGVRTTKGYLMYGEQQGAPQVGHAATSATPVQRQKARTADVGYTMEEMRSLAALYNARRSQGANPTELNGLYDSLYAAVRTSVTAQAPVDAEEELIDELTKSFVERFTRSVQAAEEAVAHRKRR